jgi:hypothetical protein
VKYGSLNYDGSEGTARPSKDFASLDGVIRLDVINDWIGDLMTLYDEAYVETYGRESYDRAISGCCEVPYGTLPILGQIPERPPGESG